MSQLEINATVEELQELKRMREELADEIATLEDKIKAAMGERESITAGAFKVSYKAVTTSRIDSAALANVLPDVAQRFTKTITVRRFSIR